MALNWRTDKPGDADKFSEFPATFRSQKSSLRSGLENTTFHWNDSSASAGQLRHSVSTTGAARAFYAARSEVSDPERYGTMMIVSDESRALLFNSTQSVCVGSNKAYHAVVAGGTKAQPEDQRRVVAFGVEDLGAEGASRISLGLLNGSALTYATTGFIGVPVVVQASADDGISGNSYLCTVFSLGSSSFSVYNRYIGPGADPGTCRIFWRSCGTVTVVNWTGG